MKKIHNEIFYATGNVEKFKTAQVFLKQQVPQISLQQLTFDVPEEQTTDQLAISRNKALAAWHHIQKPVLADDAGIFFDAYPNFPGFMTKFVWQSLGVEGIFKLLDQNQRITTRLFLTYCNGPHDIHQFVGECHGVLRRPEHELERSSGKPFTYMMVSDGDDRAFGYLEQTPHNSFRLNGLQKFADWYSDTQLN